MRRAPAGSVREGTLLARMGYQLVMNHARRVVSAAGGIVRRSLKRRHHPVGVLGTGATRLADYLCRSANRSRSPSLGQAQPYKVSLSMESDIPQQPALGR